ncbi:RFA2 [Acanthosepion pharaonis]|uniref:RFA2 n=1 Tax=Acanthosepion pharaonis TaxID=158019 RepID=A0A812E8A6_ACAPH|nr:RFA2 [Sepia pharaonis]
MWSTQSVDDSYNPNNDSLQGGYMAGRPGGEEDEKEDDLLNVVPVTIAEVLNATQSKSKFYSGKIPLSHVQIIGWVKSVEESSTRFDYEIEDYSGVPLTVKQFVLNEGQMNEDEKMKPFPEKTYVRACGKIRSFGGQRCVVAGRIFALSDMNELTTHLLEIIHGHMMFSTIQETNHKQSVNNNDYETSSFGIPGLGHLHNQVHQIIKSTPDDEGCDISKIFRQLRGVTENNIRDVIEFLSAEGHIYSTIDETHFKATDG